MKKLLILGAGGMVGSALVRAAENRGYKDILTPCRKSLDLVNQADTHAYLAEHRPDEVIVAAAKVGGIHANNTYPAEFIYKNLMIAANAIEGSYQAGVTRLLFLGSSCIYPKLAPQPMPEDCLLTSELEPTNEAYAVAKIAGLKLCQHYRSQYGVMFHSAMPTNLYGPGDNYHPENSHVIPAMIRRFHEAMESGAETVTIWGTGTPRREFLYVDDLADACFHLMELESPPDWVNVGYGEDVTIIELARAVADAVGYQGKIETDPSQPDGTHRKLMDNTILRSLGWKPRVPLNDGLSSAYKYFLNAVDSGSLRSK
ncbi:MAG: GDP-L-fucose synthase [Akkermansiaceae bacterium]|nr:GDP-L-fucose synthase [Akkermansiaceae bacterium]